jgi:hypothetical protein
MAFQQIPVAARCKVWVCSRSFVGIAGSNPAGDMDVSLWSLSGKCCVLSGRSLCDGLITRREDSCRVCVSECDPEATKMRGPGPLEDVEP